VTSGIYLLDDQVGAEELAKDVAAFANAKTGGLVLVGFAKRKEHDAEVIDRVRPVARGLVDLDFTARWMKSDHDYLAPSLTRFLGIEVEGQGSNSLARDFGKFRLLLGATDGEGVFTPDEQ
jgi:hypothetical protein